MLSRFDVFCNWVRDGGWFDSMTFAAILAGGCVLCCLSLDDTMVSTFRQGHVGSAVLTAKVIRESAMDVILDKPEPKRFILLSDLSTVRPVEGGGQ